MEERIQRDILAIMPSYEVNLGNCTRLILFEEEEIVKITAKTFIKNLCKYYHFDQKASSKYFGDLLSSRSNLPLVFSRQLIYIQLKTREPIGKDDGAMGYFKLQDIKKIVEIDGKTTIRMRNNLDISLLCSMNTAKKQIKQGKLVMELLIKNDRLKVKEALEYYNYDDGPAMKSDIARLYMKLDDIISKI
ncbi:MAG: competence protein ComK [Gudongella sp.]|nr:competence protein ComK [Gudongella sp.]